MVLREIIGLVSFACAPVDVKLSLSYTIANLTETRTALDLIGLGGFGTNKRRNHVARHVQPLARTSTIFAFALRLTPADYTLLEPLRYCIYKACRIIVK